MTAFTDVGLGLQTLGVIRSSALGGIYTANKHGLTGPDSVAQVSARHGDSWTQPRDSVICSQDPEGLWGDEEPRCSIC